MSDSSRMGNFGARRMSTVAAVVLVSFVLVGSVATRTGATEPSTTPRSGAQAIYTKAAQLSGPVTVGHIGEPLSANPPGLAAHGYVEQEYFASGTASAFDATSSPNNGHWSITPTTSAFTAPASWCAAPATRPTSTATWWSSG